jgi:HD-GYP domain-containing protein (c-di-GMP phosphodiesterase class II)
MIDTYRFIAILGMATLIIGCLLLPYAGQDRRRLIAITSIYRPISLALLMVHCLSTMALAVLHIPYSSVPPITMGGALALMALEIRSSHRGPEDHRWLFLALGVLSVGLYLGFHLFTDLAMRIRAFTQSLFLTCLLAWITTEAVRARRVRRNPHYTVVLLALTFGLFALAGRNILLLPDKGPQMISVTLEGRPVLQLRFIAYGFLCFALLALNNAYSAQFWRTAVFHRRSREMTLVTALRDIAQVRDNETGMHIARTRQFVRILAGALARKGRLVQDGSSAINLLARAAPLHDVGKVAIPDHILRKPGRLSREEQQVMEGHALIGAEILRSAADSGEGDLETSALLQVATDIAGGHHENWDGSGYPLGLAGDAIPQAARIMSVADVYDALTSHRAYKAPWTHDAALAYIQRLSGSKFDPEVVAALDEEADAFRLVAQRLRDGAPNSRLFG